MSQSNNSFRFGNSKSLIESSKTASRSKFNVEKVNTTDIYQKFMKSL